ncbi:MAG: hypothetical protein K8J08_08820 [Thermoanaerobaculia bacterium]|nr:hypothetical protein [Thermoanaerobaculia bacterium]
MVALSGLLGLIALVAAILVLIHAFKASTGQGILCLCLPFYIFYYAFTKFEHEQKNLIVGALVGAAVLNILISLSGAM